MSGNITYIHEILARYFRARNFQEIPTKSKLQTVFASFQKSSLYLLNIIDAKDDHEVKEERLMEYKERLSQQFDYLSTDHIIVLYLWITDSHEKRYESLNRTPNLEEHVIDVHWIINVTSKELLIPNKQMHSVLGLEKTIQELIRTGKQEFYSVHPVQRTTYMTFLLIAINILIFVYMWYVQPSITTSTLMQFGAMSTSWILSTHEFWRLFTAMFIHVGWMHLIFNMIGLYIFGSRIEKYFSPLEFSLIYIGSGLLGSLLSFGVDYFTNPDVVSAGASGAIYGLIGCLILLSKRANRPIGGVNAYILWLFFIYGIVYSIVSPGIDVFAHMGGFIGGFIFTMPFMWKKKKQLGGSNNEKG